MSARAGAAGANRGKWRRPAFSGRLGLLGERDFKIFFAGYATSLTGSAMSQVALTFAVLGSGGDAASLGYVFAASVLPLVICMLGGGVLADRLGRRRVMLGGDAAQLVVQAGLAAVLFTIRPPIWVFIVASALAGTGEAVSVPALSGLIPQLAPPARLGDANALLSVASAAARIVGPALAGLLIAATSPAVVVAADAATFGASVTALALLRVPPAPAPARSPWRDLADGWTQFRAHTWLWLTTAQFALFNLITWAPYLLLGPVLARAYLGGARAWGVIVACYAAGSIAGGAALLGRRPARPLVAAVIGSFGYALPALALAVRAPLAAVVGAVVTAGIGSATFDTFWTTVLQQRVPAAMLARVSAFSSVGSYALGAAGYAVIGLLAGVLGPARILAFGAAYATLSSAVVLALPAIRSVTWLRPPGDQATSDQDTSDAGAA
jgi:predicted MFS family arabinose efflux permease